MWLCRGALKQQQWRRRKGFLKNLLLSLFLFLLFGGGGGGGGGFWGCGEGGRWLLLAGGGGKRQKTYRFKRKRGGRKGRGCIEEQGMLFPPSPFFKKTSFPTTAAVCKRGINFSPFANVPAFPFFAAFKKVSCLKTQNRAYMWDVAYFVIGFYSLLRGRGEEEEEETFFSFSVYLPSHSVSLKKVVFYFYGTPWLKGDSGGGEWRKKGKKERLLFFSLFAVFGLCKHVIPPPPPPPPPLSLFSPVCCRLRRSASKTKLKEPFLHFSRVDFFLLSGLLRCVRVQHALFEIGILFLFDFFFSSSRRY